MPATVGKIIVTPPFGLSVDVAITNESGTTVTTYTAANGSTAHSSPDTITATTTYYLPTNGLYVLSVKYNGAEIAGRDGNTISSYVGDSQAWSVAPSLILDDFLISADLAHLGDKVGFFGATPVTQRELTYSRALESAADVQIRTALTNLGLVVDNTTA